ncbi:MAG TPA: S8 family serine peptidase [Kofleriaceae bacterium]|nr:S8 family serine peptidase [Kofleriaceae bacterium]
MSESETTSRNRSSLLWLLLVIALAVVWWYLRPAPEHLGSSGDSSALAEITGDDPDDILVDLRDDTSDAKVAQLESELGLDLVLVSAQSQDERFYRAKVSPARRDAILAALAGKAEVELAEPDSQLAATPMPAMEVAVAPPGVATEDFPNDPQYKYQWHMRQIGMTEAWKLADGGGIVVAVLDTGVAYEDFEKYHELPDLKGIAFVDGYDFVDNDAHANDDHGHGSHVTGTIAQVTHNGIGVTGIARNVKIMPLKVLSASGSGSVAGIADAIRYAADKGAKVINMSLGGPFPSRALKNAVAYAHKKGVVVVCAAGNDGRSSVGYPAAYPGAFAVSATQFDESVTFYSNFGKAIDLAAPGGNTRVDQNGDGMPDGVLQNTIKIGDPTADDYFGYMGTSMASPHVAGVAALVVGEGVTDPAMVEKILQDSARKPNGQTYTRDRYGAGIVDAPAAVLKARADAGGYQLGLGLLLAAAAAASMRKRIRLGVGYLGGVMVGASGLFFLPYLAPQLSSLPGVELVTRGLPSWDISVLGPLAHGNALFFSALLPLGLLTVGYGVRRLRPLLAGLSIGVAAHLLFHLVVPMTEIQYMPAAFGVEGIWLAVNALVALGLARLALLPSSEA